VRAPIDGDVYQFDLKQGAYLNAGDAVASIGRLNRVKVTVYVDERDLGRVKRGMPARITWDAFPGREWMGSVDKLAQQVIARGSREVGEVECVIENPGRELVPGSNVNVDIRAESVESALTIPKEALRNENGHEGVYTLEGERLKWRTVKLGIDNTTRAQVLSGLAEGDPVALITDKTLKDGMAVTPVFP
jgi:RND family efflux transporter MFP subunit